MIYSLIQYIWRKMKESQTEPTRPTSDDIHLVPAGDYGSSQDGSSALHKAQHEQESHVDPISDEEAARQEAEAQQRTIRQWKLMLGLALPNFLAAVDVTIVAPAIPLISSYFGHLSGSFNWIVAAYTLTFTTFTPASGQLADIYGRHFALQFEMFWILVGSVLCATAQTWEMLLVGRAIQGLGAAGILSLSRIILSDGATLAENSKNNSLLSLVAGVSYAVGPIIGGHLADLGWRYLFVLPVGVAVLAMLLVFFLMRKELVRGRAISTAGESRRLGYISGLRIIDWPGIVTFILGVGLVILAIQWAGTSYAWSSAAVAAPLAIGAVLCVAFFVYEYLLGPGRFAARLFPSQVPMIPSTLFRKKDTSLLMVINFSAGISFVSAFYFISYYFQLAEGFSSSQAGTQLLYYTPGLGVGVYVAMYMCNQSPRQTYLPLVFGSVVETIGLALLTYAVSIRDKTLVKVFLAVTGAGTGLRFMPVVLHAAGIWATRIPSIQSLLSFMIPLGETIGISTMGSVFSNKLRIYLSDIAQRSSGLHLPASGLPSFDILNDLPPVVKKEVQEAAARAVTWALVSVLPFVGLSLVASIFLGNVWIGKAAVAAKEGESGCEAEEGKVLYGRYLVALFTGSVAVQKVALDVNLEFEGNEWKRVRNHDAEAGTERPEATTNNGRRAWV